MKFDESKSNLKHALKVLTGIDTKSVYLTNSMNVEENVITDPNEIATKFINILLMSDQI